MKDIRNIAVSGVNTERSALTSENNHKQKIKNLHEALNQKSDKIKAQADEITQLLKEKEELKQKLNIANAMVEKQIEQIYGKSNFSNNTFKDSVNSITNKISNMLISKNKAYGNSALDPKRIFSKASSEEQILVRIDDKLSRIANQNTLEDEDVIEDLIGYLILLKISKNKIA